MYIEDASYPVYSSMLPATHVLVFNPDPRISSKNHSLQKAPLKNERVGQHTLAHYLPHQVSCSPEI